MKNDAAYDARMAQLYREVVLKEKPATSNEGGFIPLGAIAACDWPANGNGASAKKERRSWRARSRRLTKSPVHDLEAARNERPFLFTS